MSVNSPHAVKNEKYYLLGGDLYFLVGGREFFRVHRYFFDRESEHFRKFFAETPEGGRSDSSAIVLQDLDPHEFEIFLWVFYNPLYWVYDAPQEDWAVILGLAQQWTFPRVKELAVFHLNRMAMELIDRIELYQQWEVDEDILIPYYVQLCQREQRPSFLEIYRLGERTAYIIYAAREKLRAANIREDGSSPVVEGRDVQATVQQLLQETPQAPQKDTEDLATPFSTDNPTKHSNIDPQRDGKKQANGASSSPLSPTSNASRA